MPLNVPGLIATLKLLHRPELALPTLLVPSLLSLDFPALSSPTPDSQIAGLVLDKDNLLTHPHSISLLPPLAPLWPTLLKTFGPSRILIVSNSAGTADDAGLVGAEALTRELGVPVLVHGSKKPGEECAKDVVRWFGALDGLSGVERPGVVWAGEGDQTSMALDQAVSRTVLSKSPAPKRLLVIGDRLTTDVMLGHAISSTSYASLTPSPSPIGRLMALVRRRSKEEEERARIYPYGVVTVLTTKVWQKEGMGTNAMRAVEMWWMRNAEKRKRLLEATAQHSSSSPSPSTSAISRRAELPSPYWSSHVLPSPPSPPQTPSRTLSLLATVVPASIIPTTLRSRLPPPKPRYISPVPPLWTGTALEPWYVDGVRVHADFAKGWKGRGEVPWRNWGRLLLRDVGWAGAVAASWVGARYRGWRAGRAGPVRSGVRPASVGGTNSNFSLMAGAGTAVVATGKGAAAVSRWLWEKSRSVGTSAAGSNAATARHTAIERFGVK